MPGGELSIQAQLHPSGLWLTIQVTLEGHRTLAMVLDSGSPVSAISPETADELRALDLLLPAMVPGYEFRLAAPSVQGQNLPELDVRILPRLTRLRIAGLLGLDFLSKFLAIHYYVPSRRLVLERP